MSKLIAALIAAAVSLGAFAQTATPAAPAAPAAPTAAKQDATPRPAKKTHKKAKRHHKAKRAAKTATH